MEIGPQTFIKQDNETVVEGPTEMVAIPPRHYVVVGNPVAKSEAGVVLFDVVGDQKQIKLRHGEKEIRFQQDPFPLYPGESLVGSLTQLTVVPTDSALRLRAVLDFVDTDGKKYSTGDQWQFKGPATYSPSVEVVVEDTVTASVIGPGEALRIQALKELIDHKGNKRVAGEVWQVTDQGAYLPGVYEYVMDRVYASVLTDTKAIHLRATTTFKDHYGIERKNGDEWLVTNDMASSHIADVYEEIVAEIEITTLSNRQYCVILNHCDERGRPRLGTKQLVAGPTTFFLKPGERLENGVQAIFVLGEDEGLILKATEAFEDDSRSASTNDKNHVDKEVEGAVRMEPPGDGESSTGSAVILRSPGDRWMVRGPTEFIPRVEVEVVEHRTAIPLDDNEGVYVRDNLSGRVRSVTGQSYMLTENESLWEKELGAETEALLARVTGNAGKRDKHAVVSLRVPHNAAVQLYDYTTKTARVVFGPDLIMLGPDEHFSKLKLSGSEWKRDPRTGIEAPSPKKPNMIKSLYLMLGPDFCCDVITIETADHARLSLQLAYNWMFEVDRSSQETAAKPFSVTDFVGDMCKAVASRIRGAVASVNFDDFHKHSAIIIREAVFGKDKVGSNACFRFEANGLVITSIDIQNVEPVDQRTRDALQKSVQLAIEITTNSQEATATHEAQRQEQEAKGRLERQRITDQAEAEVARKELLVLQAESSAVESTGQSKAEAQSRAEAARIEGEAAVQQASLKAKAQQIEAESELARLQAARAAELEYTKSQNALLVDKLRSTAQIEQDKFSSMVDAIGQETLKSIAVSGPETQAKLLGSLGIKSTLITDGKTPINLFQTAAGLMGSNIMAPYVD